MAGHDVEFIAASAPRDLSRAIEEYAKRRGILQVIVVPWESSATMLAMAVTAVNIDGWAIEHTNLGTIHLTDLGSDRTRVVLLGHEPSHPKKDQLVAAFDRFARQLHDTFRAAASDAD